MRLNKYSIGTGDRFGCQGKAQLKAIIKAQEVGIDVAIVWNKSHREHLITKTNPADVLKEAQNAVRDLYVQFPSQRSQHFAKDTLD